MSGSTSKVSAPNAAPERPGKHDAWLRVEYTGGKAPVAAELGLEEFDYGVYQGWAPKQEVTDMRESRL